MRRGRAARYADRSLRVVILAAVIACMTSVDSGCRRSSPQERPAQQPVTTTAAPSDETPGAADESPSTTSDLPPRTASAPLNAAEFGKQLFARHCAACHGERGDGKGIAATFLFPKPRDFRAGRFRLVSTNNNVPTRDDLLAVLARGMPGSSMPPWAHLSAGERDALVDEILRIRREGARETYVKSLKEDEGLTDEEIAADDVQKEIQDYVDEFTTPGEGTEVPDVGSPTDETIARGKQVYAKFACIQCHGGVGTRRRGRTDGRRRKDADSPT